MEPVVEQIAQKIAGALDGVRDIAGSITLSVIRPAIIDWEVTDYAHGNVLMEAIEIETVEATLPSRVKSGTRFERVTFRLYGLVRHIPDNLSLDTMLSRVSQTIRRVLLHGDATGGLASKLDCPAVQYAVGEGCGVVEVIVEAEYQTDYNDGYVLAT